MKLIVKKCEICGKEFTSYARNAKYCKKTCYKVSVFNKSRGLNLTSMQEVEEYKKKNNIRGQIQFKPIMQFKLDGTYVTTIRTGVAMNHMGDGNGYYSRKQIGECARGLYLSYRDYIWIYEEDYTKELLKERVEKYSAKHDYCKKPIVALTTDGEFVCRYESVAEGANKNYIHKNNLINHLKRKNNSNSCVGYIWMYEEDYLRRAI